MGRRTRERVRVREVRRSHLRFGSTTLTALAAKLGNRQKYHTAKIVNVYRKVNRNEMQWNKPFLCGCCHFGFGVNVLSHHLIATDSVPLLYGSVDATNTRLLAGEHFVRTEKNVCALLICIRVRIHCPRCTMHDAGCRCRFLKKYCYSAHVSIHRTVKFL